MPTKRTPTKTAAKTSTKTTAKRSTAAAAKRAAETGRFTLTDFPDTFTCAVCGGNRPSRSFPTVTSGQPELRKTECRQCRGLRTGYLVES